MGIHVITRPHRDAVGAEKLVVDLYPFWPNSNACFRLDLEEWELEHLIQRLQNGRDRWKPNINDTTMTTS